MEDTNKSRAELLAEIQSLRDRLTISEEIVRAIQEGEVDALVISTPQGQRIFTLQSADLSYRLLVEEMQQGAVVLSSEGLILYCNKSFSNLLKQPLEKLIGSYFHSLISPQDTLLFQARVRQAERGERHPVELFLKTKDGVEIPVYLSINNLILDRSPINCLVITDLTEQKRHQKTIVAERLARLILEQAGEAILVCDDTGQIIRASAIAQELWGENLLFQPFDRLQLLYLPKLNFSSATSAEETLSQNYLDAEIENKVPFSIIPVLEGESYKGLEVEFERRDGEVLNLVLNARPLADRDNHFKGAVVILTNITQRKQAENALQAAKNELELKVIERTQELQETNNCLQLELLDRQQLEQQFAIREAWLNAFFTYSPVGMAILDNQLRFVQVNENAAQMSNLAIEQHLGKSLEELFPSWFSTLQPIYQQVLNTGESILNVEVEGDDTCNPGSRGYWLVSYHPIFNLTRQVIGIGYMAIDISARKRAEESLQQYKRIISTTTDGIVLLNRNYIYQMANPAYLSWQNKSAPEIVGYSVSNMIGEEVFKNLKPLLDRCLAGEIIQFEKWFKYPDSVKKFLSVTYTPYLTTEGDVSGVLVSLRDITQLKQAEESLQQSESTLRSFFNSGSMLMGIVEIHNGDILHISDNWAAAKFFETTPEAMKNQFASTLGVPPAIIERWTAYYQQSQQIQAPVRFEYFYETSTNQGWLSVSVCPIEVSSSGYPRFSYVAQDITDRKRAEAALAKSEEQLRLTFDFTHIGTWDWNVHTNETIWNNNHFHLLGIEPQPESDRYQLWRNAIHPEDLDRIEQALLNALIQHTDYEAEYRVIYPDGTVHWLVGKGRGIYNEAGEALRMLGVIFDVSDRKQAEQMLELQAVIARNMAEGICLVRADNGVIVYANPKFEQMFGYDSGELNGQHVSIVNYGNEQIDPEEVNQSIRTAVLQRGEFTYQVHNVKKDGTPFWCSATCSVFKHPEYGDVFVAVQQDITARKQAEEALRDSEEKFRQFAENIQDVFWMTDIQKKQILYVSPAYEIIWQRSCQSVYQNLLNWLDTIHPDDRPQVEAAYIQQQETGIYDQQYRIIRPDNSIRWIRDRGFPIRDESGKIMRMTGIAEDISDRKQAESELRELNLALENAVEGIARLDTQGRYISVNRAYTEKCGYQVSEMVGMEWQPTVHPEDRPKMLAAYQEMLTKGKIEAEAKGLRKDGSTFYKQLVMICAYDREKNFVGHYCFMKDITERKQAEVELAAAKEAAEAANRAKSEFLANMSHEIRTPMNAILGFSELLQESIFDPQPRTYLNSIAASGRTLLALINDILDLSKIEAGKLQLEYEPVDVRSLIREIQQILDQTAVKKSLSLLVEIDETVPKAILFDAIRLRQILFNTVGNALKFTESGFVKISVRAQLEPSTLSNRVQIEITVADTGIGICFDQQESIFEAFKQSEGQSTRKYGGTGLGLAITKRLTEMLGGTVGLQSELGKGSAFTFIFPNLTITEIETPPVVPSNLDEDLNQFSTATVLVVDDVKYNLDLIAGYFAGSKHRLLFAGDGQEAIEIAQTHCPDAILMDLWMPNMDGLQAMQLLKQDEGTKNIPIAIVTAVSRSQDEDTVRALSQGFLRKPVSRSQLVSALKQILPQEPNYFPVNETSITPSQTHWIKPNPKALEKLPELVEKLRQEEESTWLELRRTMKRREIQAFIERLREWAHEYQCQLLFDYMTTLESQLAAFEWEQLPKTIEKFPDVRHQLL